MPRERIHPQQDDGLREPRPDDDPRAAAAPAMRDDSPERGRPSGRSTSTAVALVIALAVVVIVLIFVL